MATIGPLSLQHHTTCNTRSPATGCEILKYVGGRSARAVPVTSCWVTRHRSRTTPTSEFPNFKFRTQLHIMPLVARTTTCSQSKGTTECCCSCNRRIKRSYMDQILPRVREKLRSRTMEKREKIRSRTISTIRSHRTPLLVAPCVMCWSYMWVHRQRS